MTDIAEWLAGLGLDRYASVFADNAVDLLVLPTLTADDLKELGVRSVGDRRKLLNAIAALPAGSAAPATPREAERRQLTVLFVDLVDSTALARRLDPEDMSGIIRRYQNTVAGEIARLEGHVAKYMGDGVLAYFGWPRAHEDEAERAVRAALAVVAAVGRLVAPGGHALSARAGIATGTVVVGEPIGEGSAHEETVVGETPSLAARLQALAPAGGVLVGEATRRLLGELFELAPLGAAKLKGFGARVPTWRVLGDAAGRSRFEAQRGPDLPPMVGRELELGLLLEHWALARGGKGQAVLVIGEAGIGKSRLLRGLCDAAGAERFTQICWQASPFHGGSPLWPIAQELRSGPEGADIPALERRLAESGVDAGQAIPLLTSLLGLPAGERHPSLQPSAEAQRHRLLRTLLDHLAGLAARCPLLVVLEDAQWADPTTLELTRLLLERMAAARMLLVVLSRPEGAPDLPDTPHLRRLTLGRLDRAAAAAMVAGLTPGGGALPALVETIVGRTDGVPLFVEELTRALAESGAGGSGPEHDVPASLHDTLMARLDRLPGVKEVAQIAACIGRAFDYRLLAAVADRPEAELGRSLDRLCAAQLLLRDGAGPSATYSFKHALLRDVAYESLLKSRRRAIHERLLKVLEGEAAPAIEQLAHHAAAAEQWPKALDYYGAAGRAAVERAAYGEGLNLLAEAFAAGAHLSGDTGAEVAMIDLRRVRCWAFLATGEMQRLMVELREAEGRAGRFGMTRLSGQLRAQRAHVETIFGGHARRAIGYGGEATRIAARVGDAELTSSARFVLGQALWAAGDYNRAAAELGVDADAYRGGLRIAQLGSGGTLAVDGLSILGGCLGQVGRWDEALARAAEAQAVAGETGHPTDLVGADWHLARTLLTRGDTDRAMPLLERSIELAERFGLHMMLLWCEALLGHARCLAGRFGEGVARLDRALAGCDERRLRYILTYALLLKAEASLGRGDGAALAVEGVELARAHGYRALEVTGLRLLATTAADPSAAGRHLADAQQIAAALGLAPELALIAARQTRIDATF
jgi:class 3 adenylate cyclase/tetratricopeptide (TPR) repeat protein